MIDLFLININIRMNNSPQLLLTLQEYIVELQTQNRSLKHHIFQLQHKLQIMTTNFHDEIEKLKVYIEHCDNEIVKRQNREIGLIELVKEMQQNKEDICRQRDIYIQQLQEIRADVLSKQAQISRLEKQEEKYKKLLSQQPKNIINLPPKSNKCKNCEVYIKNQEVLNLKILEYEENIKALQKDIQCIQQFI